MGLEPLLVDEVDDLRLFKERILRLIDLSFRVSCTSGVNRQVPVAKSAEKNLQNEAPGQRFPLHGQQ
jgi:hypothetical protein